MLVEAFPEVPRYRALLGKALLLAGNGEAAEEQLQEATSLSPLSEEVYVEVGAALRDAGRLEAAAARYERAVELEPKNQLYNLDLGRIYSTLSTAGGWNEGYFEKPRGRSSGPRDSSPCRDLARIRSRPLCSPWVTSTIGGTARKRPSPSTSRS
jgi:tetratricopeptide (TPR) repeat protein